ncbi:hypothetical protein [Polyangium fumosum]|uniref:Uncharacterized protein n=1 Tax=Polyangium fumosum TaxID=889272 RepID=A0A4U1IXM8_9BACT|nr:hypothetical protein [Polyangium fumosum]TKC99313.1 hypothetical protein E8A74_38510 [Polyangium fumosum]
MKHIEYEVLYRLLTRAAEIAAEPAMHPSVVTVYENVLQSPAQAFRKAHVDLLAAESVRAKERDERGMALDALDGHYKVARSVLLAFAPHTVLPDTLKAQTTDTDKVNAATRLFDMLGQYAGNVWADELLAGPFGVITQEMVKEHDEAVAAEMALAKARAFRQEACSLAYEKLLAYKRVVRDALGATSKQYRRIHLLRGSAKEDAAVDSTP